MDVMTITFHLDNIGKPIFQSAMSYTSIKTQAEMMVMTTTTMMMMTEPANANLLMPYQDQLEDQVGICSKTTLRLGACAVFLVTDGVVLIELCQQYLSALQ
jgi:hypothetical protein